jgi:flagellar protein FlgJ
MAELSASLNAAASAATASTLATDSRSLDALRTQAKNDPDKALKQAASQFEALFMQMLLKSMRDATPQYDPTASDAGRMYTGMLDQQLSQSLTSQTQSGGGKGLGLADVMLKQLSRQKAPADQKAELRQTPRVGLEKFEQANMAARGDAGKPQQFVDRMLPEALAASKASGVPARFILGQAALESGWGRSEIRGADGAASHNLFGVKAGTGWTGRTVSVMTTEYINGQPHKQVEKFRAYDSYAEGFSDYARLIANNPRYAAAVRPGNDAAGFAQGLARGGYATDPAYAAKLTRVINSNLLAQRGQV